MSYNATDLVDMFIVALMQRHRSIVIKDLNGCPIMQRHRRIMKSYVRPQRLPYSCHVEISRSAFILLLAAH